MSGVIPPLLDVPALNQGMIAPMNAAVATDQTPTPITYRFLNSLWDAERQIWAQVISFQSTLEAMVSDIITNTANITTNTASIATINGEITIMQGQIVTIQGQIVTINTTLTSLQSQITTINSRLAAAGIP